MLNWEYFLHITIRYFFIHIYILIFIFNIVKLKNISILMKVNF